MIIESKAGANAAHITLRVTIPINADADMIAGILCNEVHNIEAICRDKVSELSDMIRATTAAGREKQQLANLRKRAIDKSEKIKAVTGGVDDIG